MSLINVRSENRPRIATPKVAPNIRPTFTRPEDMPDFSREIEEGAMFRLLRGIRDIAGHQRRNEATALAG